jgi:hypothetical protein
MADKLSLPNLLSLLQFDSQDDDIIRNLCEMAEELRRCRRYDEAIETAENAVHLAHIMPNSNYSLRGVTLLYLAAARLSSGLHDQHLQAIRDSDRAITSFSREPHNRAVAEIMRAQAELYQKEDDSEHRRHALIHLQRAVQTLLELSTDWRVPSDLKQDEAELLSAVYHRISELVALHNKAPETTVVPGQSNQPATEPSSAPIKLAIPTQLVWPVSDSIGLGLVPAYGLFGTDPNRDSFEPGKTGLDYIQVSRISINGRPYAIHPIHSPSGGHSGLCLRLGQQYLTFRIQGNAEETSHPDEYILVRRQDLPDPTGQQVVLTDPLHKRVWIASELVPPRIFGGAGDEQAKSQDKRVWKVMDSSEDYPYSAEEVRVIGVIEAILTPIASSEPSHLSAPATPPQANIDDDQVSERLVPTQR